MKGGRPTWLTNLPFIMLHVACLSAFFVRIHAIDLVLLAATYLIRMVGITAGYHRYFSHRSYKTSRLGQFFLAWLGCSALQKGPLWWAAHHRDHHRFSDTEDDPHSPIMRSIWWAHVGWILAPDYDATDRRRVRDLNRYPELVWLDHWHWVPGIFLAVACWLIDGWSGVVWGFVISTVVLYHAVFLVNSLCHLAGARRYETTDRSRNNLFVALVTLGEGWHNNHHHYQSSANQGFYWWEVDFSYYLIRMFGWVGLVWDVRRPPRKILREGRAQTPAMLSASASAAGMAADAAATLRASATKAASATMAAATTAAAATRAAADAAAGTPAIQPAGN